jgi:hypothetical protein
MCCEHLICANCSGPVSEGHCNVCRGSRQQMGHHEDNGGGLTVTAMAVLLIALTIAVALLTTAIR